MKKISLMLILACAFICARAQEQSYTIKGKAEGIPANTNIYLLRYDLVHGQRKSKAVLSLNGEFAFTGTVAEPDLSQMFFGSDDGVNEIYTMVFYLEKGTINISVKAGKRYPVLSGTPLSNDFNDFNVIMDHMLDSVNAAKHPEEAYTEISDELKKEKLQLMEKFVPVHPNSLLTLHELNYQVAHYPDEVTELARLYNMLTPAVQKTQDGKDMGALIRGLSSNKIGDTALDLSLPDSTGKIVKLSNFRGKYVLLDFWATWCIPCMEEMPNVANAYKKYRDKNFTVVGVSLDRPDTKALWEKVIKEQHMDWTQVSDLKWWNSEAALLYNIQGVPANFLIDPNGKIIDVDLRGPALQQKLAGLLVP